MILTSNPNFTSLNNKELVISRSICEFSIISLINKAYKFKRPIKIIGIKNPNIIEGKRPKDL